MVLFDKPINKYLQRKFLLMSFFIVLNFCEHSYVFNDTVTSLLSLTNNILIKYMNLFLGMFQKLTKN